MIGWGLMSQANIPVPGLPVILYRLSWVGARLRRVRSQRKTSKPGRILGPSDVRPPTDATQWRPYPLYTRPCPHTSVPACPLLEGYAFEPSLDFYS